jgi:sucrose phosphorylase
MHNESMKDELPQGVMFNAYPDSIGHHLSDTIELLKRPEFKGAFSLFYILPTFFNSDLDRGFSVIDYDINRELVSERDLRDLQRLGIMLKFDLVLNHLSVASPQFQDLLHNGDDSPYRDFFIDWNEFWADEGEMGPDGHLVPDEEHLQKLFMRKPGLPILMVRFPDGSERPYWNTFYQKVTYQELLPEDLDFIDGLSREQTESLADMVNDAIRENRDIASMDFGKFSPCKDKVITRAQEKRQYLGQMDINGQSAKAWEFYEETLEKLAGYGARLIRLDAFAYLHKQPGESNFFNKPGTWDYLERLRRIAEDNELILLPEIHAEYGKGLHGAVAAEGYPIYDFFFPGLLIDALDRSDATHLLRWIREVKENRIKTVNMLGCHDGIPVLDLKGNGEADGGLLSDREIDQVMERIMERGGRVKDLYGPDGKKISYYQVNATFFSALGEDERKLRLARAIQMFIPGIPQVWYLDLFAGKNDYAAADMGGPAGHKEINRTTLQLSDIEHDLKRIVVQDQLQLIRFRNNCSAFSGDLEIRAADPDRLHLTWKSHSATATLNADLKDLSFSILHRDDAGAEGLMSYR